MSNFKELKAAFVRLAGKNPPPMSADALAAKVAELEAAAQAGGEGGGDQSTPPAGPPPALEPAADGLEVELLTSMAGERSYVPGDRFRCADEAEVARMCEAGYAKPIAATSKPVERAVNNPPAETR